MKWSDLKDTVGKFAPLLGSFLGGSGGQLFGQIIADLLGVEQSPEAVAEALAKDGAAALAIKKLEADHKEALLAVKIRLAEHIVAANTAAQAEVNLTMRKELESEHWFYKSWRPFFGFIMSIAFGSTMMMPVILIWFHPDRLATFTEFLAASVVIWSIGFGVLGVYVHKRSQDKITEQGLVPTSTLNALKKQFRSVAANG